MPPRKVIKLKRKRPYKRNRRVFRRRVPRNPRTTILPRRLFVKLKYASDQIGTTVSTSYGVHQFALNGCHDPDLTGGGHQPMGWDQLKALYNDYRVHACGVKVEGMMLTSGTSGIVAVGAKLGGGLPTSLAALMEDTSYSHRIVNSERPFVIKRYFDVAKVAGKSKTAIRGEADFSAGVGANPTTGLGYISVAWQNVDSTTSTGFNIRVTLTYYLEFNDLAVLATS